MLAILEPEEEKLCDSTGGVTCPQVRFKALKSHRSKMLSGPGAEVGNLWDRADLGATRQHW